MDSILFISVFSPDSKEVDFRLPVIEVIHLLVIQTEAKAVVQIYQDHIVETKVKVIFIGKHVSLLPRLHLETITNLRQSLDQLGNRRIFLNEIWRIDRVTPGRLENQALTKDNTESRNEVKTICKFLPNLLRSFVITTSFKSLTKLLGNAPEEVLDKYLTLTIIDLDKLSMPLLNYPVSSLELSLAMEDVDSLEINVFRSYMRRNVIDIHYQLLRFMGFFQQ
jgi:hypothetical protein